MSPSSILCPACGASCTVPAAAWGKSARCPTCQTLFPVPAAGDVVDLEPGPKRRRKNPNDISRQLFRSLGLYLIWSAVLVAVVLLIISLAFFIH